LAIVPHVGNNGLEAHRAEIAAPRRYAIVGVRRLGVLLIPMLLVACSFGTQNAAIPAGMAEVESARRSLIQNEETPIRSSFSFRSARCRADGGLLLIFDVRHLYGHGVALARQGPGAEHWVGGWGVMDLESDPEIIHFFSEQPEVACA
jgi:hypothetical protein